MNGKSTKAVRVGWMAAALLPLFAGLASAQMGSQLNAQIGQDQQVAPMPQTREFHPKLEKANQLIGAKVLDSHGKRLGTIKDVVLTPDRSAIDYAVLSYGGFWGTPEKFFAVPWSQFHVGSDGKTFVLNVDVNALRSVQGIDKRNWPATADERWMEGRRSPVAGMPASDLQYRKLSALTGMNVTNMQGNRIGKLRDILIDVQQGKVAYGVLSLNRGYLEADKDQAVVPWSALEVLPQTGMARLNADKQTLDAVAFNARNFPNLEDPQYSRQLYERFNATPYWQTLGYVPPVEGAERQGTSPWMAGSDYNSLYKADAVRTIHGTVKSVGTFRLEGTSIRGLSLQIVTDEGKMMTVHVGPYPYVERQNTIFHPGDKVTIIGSPASWNGRDVVLASQIKVGDKTVDLRSNEGKPLWNVKEFRDFGAGNAPALQGSATAGNNYESGSAPAPKGSDKPGNPCD